MSTPVPLDRVTSLALDPGGRVVVRGVVTTSVDGSSFDVVLQWDGLSAGASRPGGLFDLASGGLRVVEQHAERHEYVLAAAGEPGTACATLGYRRRVSCRGRRRWRTSACAPGRSFCRR